MTTRTDWNYKSLLLGGISVLMCAVCGFGHLWAAQSTPKMPTHASIAPKKANALKPSPVATAVFSFSSTWVWGQWNDWRDIPNASVKITTTGRPVFVGIVPDNGTAEPYTVLLSCPPQQLSSWKLALIRDSNFSVNAVNEAASLIPSLSNHGAQLSVEMPFNLTSLDVPEPGDHIYSLRVIMGDGSLEIKGARLVAYEL